MFAVNSSDPDSVGLEGMRISLYDDSMTDNASECGSEARPINVNYNLVCIDDPDDDTIVIPSVTGNETSCGMDSVLFGSHCFIMMDGVALCSVYNITMMSRWSCARIVSGRENESIVDELSFGSLFLLIFGIIFGCYVVVGCGYNGVVNGRAGVDAMPNRKIWHSLCRHCWAGCVTTKETCCFCGSVPTTYQQI